MMTDCLVSGLVRIQKTLLAGSCRTLEVVPSGKLWEAKRRRWSLVVVIRISFDVVPLTDEDWKDVRAEETLTWVEMEVKPTRAAETVSAG